MKAITKIYTFVTIILIHLLLNSRSNEEAGVAVRHEEEEANEQIIQSTIKLNIQFKCTQTDSHTYKYLISHQIVNIIMINVH